jgi:SAM-dependent methyltransferase
MEVDNAKLEALMGRMIGELGAAINVPLMMIGDRLGLFKAMAEAGPLTSQQLAQKTGTDERYLREWLSAMAAGDIVKFDPAANTFTLPNEQALALAVDESPVNLQGAFSVISSTYNDWEHLADAFQTGRGVGWHEHHHSLFSGTDRFFRPGYRSHLISEWIPALDGVEQRLKAGAKVADVGCGFGSSTILMAQAFPSSQFFGFDYHDASVEAARGAAEAAGLAGRLTFEVASAKAFDGGDYDLIAVFDCLHDMGDPEGAARHIRKALKSDGAFMIAEPFAGDRLEDNLNPVGRMYYAASTMICTPGIQGTGSQRLPRSASRRSPHQKYRRQRRFHPLPPSRPNPLQPDLRSETLINRVTTGTRAGPSPHKAATQGRSTAFSSRQA